MRLRGINTRYLLLLLTHLKHEYNKSLATTELIARFIKNEVRKQWRELGKLSSPSVDQCNDDQPYNQVVCSYFNSIFGSHSEEFWNHLREHISEQKFPLRDHAIEDALPGSIKQQVRLGALLLRLEDLLGIQFDFHLLNCHKTGSALDDQEQLWENLFACEQPVQLKNIQGILPKVKYMNRITFEEGTALSRLALVSKNEQETLPLLERACVKYKEALAIRPNDTRALYNWGLSLAMMASTKPPEEAQYYYNQAREKYKAALVINPRDHRALFMWANMLTEQSRTASRKHKIDLLKEVCIIFFLVLPFRFN